MKNLNILDSEKKSPFQHLNMNEVATIILGGGQGARLFPLTMTNCKPALSLAGRYRLIDIPISNAINSACSKIFVLTQFLSSSLHKHVLSTYRFSSFSQGFIELLSAEEKPQNRVWFQGTADAVRQSLDHITNVGADYFLILSGDQLYHMDFRHLFECAIKTDADAVISCLNVNETDAKRMGVVKIDKNQRIQSFKEKPQSDEELKKLRITQEKPKYLASMGIYLFKKEVLLKLLIKDKREDFGKHLIPTLVAQGNTVAYTHKGYWEDIGTIASFYNANLALTKKKPLFDLHREDWRTFSSPISLPGASVNNSEIDNAILCEGARVEGAHIVNSIIGPRILIKQGGAITNTYIIGNDFYTPPLTNSRLPSELCIGENCQLKNVIIDKHVHIGNNVNLTNKNKLTHYDSDNLYIRDGIIVVCRGSTIRDNFVL